MQLNESTKNRSYDLHAAFVVFIACLLVSFSREAGELFTTGIALLNP